MGQPPEGVDGAAAVRSPGAGWRTSAEDALRRLATLSAAGALLGLVVAGVGSRLAMLLLARLNPQATGRQSDDDFTMGQFTVGNTVNLLVVTTVLGVLGAGVYAALRGLRTGVTWFDVLALSVGPGVVVGAVIVHTDGVDFRLLDPPLLAIALFVAVPAGYAGALAVLAERWLRSEGTRARRWWTLTPLVLWIPLAPMFAVLALGWAAREGVRRTPAGAATLGHPAAVWTARAALVALFALGLADLTRDTVELT